jgi:hypothetical protein
MPNVPGAYLAGQKIAGVVDGTTISGAHFIAFGQQGEVLIYSGTPAEGNLIAAISGAAGADDYGNTYPAGELLQGSGDVFTITGTSGQSLVAEINSDGVPELQMSTGAAEEGVAANIEAFITNPGSSEAMTLFVYGPQGSTYVSQTGIFLNSATKSGSFEAGANLVYFDENRTSHLLLGWGSGGITIGSLIAGDLNVYQGERLTLPMPGDNPLTINTTAPGQQVFATATVGTGTYHVHGQLGVHPGQAAGVPSFEFGGGAASAGMRIAFKEWTVESSFVNDNMGWVTGFASAFTGTTFGADDRLYEFDGTVVVNTAGDFALFAATSNASDTYEIYGYASYMEISPVGT